MNTDMMRHNTSDRCVNCFHDKSVCEQLKGCIVENDKNFDDEQETLKRSYEQGRADKELYFQQGYNQGEEDAINKLLEHFYPCNNCDTSHCDEDYFINVCCDNKEISYDDLLNYKEQLKEQSNDNTR